MSLIIKKPALYSEGVKFIKSLKLGILWRKKPKVFSVPKSRGFYDTRKS